MRMVLVNPGQTNMLLTGELAGKDCTGSMLLQATPAQAQAEMRRSAQQAAAAAAERSMGWHLLRQHVQGSCWQQQQQQQQRSTTNTAVASSSDSGTAGAVSDLQQLLAGLSAGDVPAVGDMQCARHQEQQRVQLQVQQQQRTVAGDVEQRQLPPQAVQQAREQDVTQQQQQLQQASGSSPTSITFLQRIGASFWSRSSSSRRQSTSDAAAAAPTTPDPSELSVPRAAAAAADHSSRVGALASSIQQLLTALQQLAAVASAAVVDDEVDSSSKTAAAAAAAAGQDQLLHLALLLQQHQLCSADVADELCCALRRISRVGNHVMQQQVPGFDCGWGLDVDGSDAQLQMCRRSTGRSAGGSGGLPNAPVALDATTAAAAGLQGVFQSCRAVQAAAAAAASADEASAIAHDSAAAEAAVEVVQQLMQDLAPFPASLGALTLHSQQQQQQQQAGDEAGRPCLAVLRIWRLQQQQQCGCSTPQQLAPAQQQLVLPFVVLCSERSVGVSPCGRLLVAVVAVRPASSSSSCSRAAECVEQLDASKEEFHQVRAAWVMHGLLWCLAAVWAAALMYRNQKSRTLPCNCSTLPQGQTPDAHELPACMSCEHVKAELQLQRTIVLW
jgi:hypothetical protein